MKGACKSRRPQTAVSREFHADPPNPTTRPKLSPVSVRSPQPPRSRGCGDSEGEVALHLAHGADQRPGVPRSTTLRDRRGRVEPRIAEAGRVAMKQSDLITLKVPVSALQTREWAVAHVLCPLRQRALPVGETGPVQAAPLRARPGSRQWPASSLRPAVREAAIPDAFWPR